MAQEVRGSPAGRLPWWVTALAGLACAAVGLGLAFRPFTSLSVLVLVVGIAMVATGVGKLTDEAADGRTGYGWLAGAAWIVGGLVALGRPDLTTRGIALIAGVSMILGGVLDVLSGVRGSTDERVAAIIWGVASAVFGLTGIARRCAPTIMPSGLAAGALHLTDQVRRRPRRPPGGERPRHPDRGTAADRPGRRRPPDPPRRATAIRRPPVRAGPAGRPPDLRGPRPRGGDGGGLAPRPRADPVEPRPLAGDDPTPDCHGRLRRTGHGRVARMIHAADP